MIKEIENIFTDFVNKLKIELERQFPSTVQTTQPPAETKSFLGIYNSLKDQWPEAVPSYLICDDTEADRISRAEGVLDYIGDDLTGKKVLDFGCGDGTLAKLIGDKAATSVGYDLNINEQVFSENYMLTNSLDQVKSLGPFDLILLYDVLDHCENPVDVLKSVAGLCHKTTKILVRCHSWMSRHGGHLYKYLNKAWIHLFLTEEDCASLGVPTTFTNRVYYPIVTQQSWFDLAGFSVASSDIIHSAVEPFFKKKELHEILGKQFNREFPEFQMSQEFNDYVLKIK